jgi:hypothetical protein
VLRPSILGISLENQSVGTHFSEASASCCEVAGLKKSFFWVWARTVLLRIGNSTDGLVDMAEHVAKKTKEKLHLNQLL